MSTISAQRKKLSFFREVQNELKKVTWTSRAELITSTKAVMIATFMFGFAIYLCDLGIHGVVNGLGALAQKIFG
jgi:preprotein translocase SecE subunit